MAGSPAGIGFAWWMLATTSANVIVRSTPDRIHQRGAGRNSSDYAAFSTFGDLTDELTVSQVIDVTSSELGSIDILANNAGGTSVTESGHEEADRASSLAYHQRRASIARSLDTSFSSPERQYRTCKPKRWGRIISVTSVTGPVMAMRHDPDYAAVTLAVDHAADGITVNAVAPGWIETGSQTPHEKTQGLSTPIGRSATPDEVASAVAWLATPGAAYTTGQIIVVDGGNSIAEERS